MRSLSDFPQRERILIIVGIVLVCLGILGLANGYSVFGWLNFLLSGVIRIVRLLLLAVAIVSLAALVAWAHRSGRLQNVKRSNLKGSFQRSQFDRRVLGVCGGIAQYSGIDSTIVRVAALLLFVAFPFITTILYLVLGLVPNSH